MITKKELIEVAERLNSMTDAISFQSAEYFLTVFRNK